MKLAMVLVTWALLDPLQNERLAPPSEEAQSRSEKTIRDVFKSEYASKATPAKQKLATTLFQQGLDTRDDAAMQYVLFREAAQIAGRSGDLSTLLKATGELCGRFKVDSPSLQESFLTKVDTTLLSTDDLARLAEAEIRLVHEAMEHEAFDVAGRVAQEVLAPVKKLKDISLAGKAEVLARTVSEARTASDRSKAAGTILEKVPEDPAANQAKGEYLCFFRGKWNEGLPFLSKGTEGALRSLAIKELGAGTAPVAAADGWWEYAEGEKSATHKQSAREHASVIYIAALPGTSGLTRIRIEKRVGSVEGKVLPKAAVSLLKLVDLKQDTLKGSWKLDGQGHLLSSPGQALLQIPYLPPEEYDLKVSVIPSGGAEVNLGLVFGKVHFDITIDGWTSTFTGIELIDGAMANMNETAHKGQLLNTGTLNTIQVLVRRTSIALSVNGSPIVQWKADAKRLGLHPLWNRTKNGTVSIGGWVPFEVAGVEIVPVSGEGRAAR